jgi:hypothetical protein
MPFLCKIFVDFSRLLKVRSYHTTKIQNCLILLIVDIRRKKLSMANPCQKCSPQIDHFWRREKFQNNFFYWLQDYGPRAERKLPFNFNFENFYEGREQDMLDATALESRTNEVYLKPDETSNLYYAEEEPDTLHSDRSPYTFQPADTQSRYITVQYSTEKILR